MNCCSQPALIKLTSIPGNSFFATSLHEYIEAPFSLTMQYFVLPGSIPSRSRSEIHASVSRQAVPLPSAIKSHLQHAPVVKVNMGELKKLEALLMVCQDLGELLATSLGN